MIMFRAVLVFLLLTITILNQKNQLYQIVPSIPPQAFVGEYYTCDFRVQGLQYPTYKFTNLPSFLRRSGSGRIEGIPNKKGSYTISVSFKQGNILGQTQLILSVSNPFQLPFALDTESSASQTDEYNYNRYAPYQYPFIPSIFNTGDNIFLNLSYYYGGYNHLWSYMKLPSELAGTDNGCLNGTFYQQGLYSYAAIRSDQNGKIKTFIITLNIQPSYFYAFWGGYYLDEVPVRDKCRCYEKTLETQKKASIQVAQSKANVELAQKRVNEANNNITKQAVSLTLAKDKLKTQATLKQITIAKQTKIEQLVTNTKNKYNLARKQFELSQIKYGNKKFMYVSTTQKLKLVQIDFEESKNDLEIVNKNFISAQNSSYEAALAISSLQVTISGFKDDVQTTLSAVGNAKNNLANFQNLLMNCSFDTKNAQNAKQIATLQNDISNSDLHQKQSTLNQTLLQLKNANQNVIDFKEQLYAASVDLGQAKFNLTQAMNQLLIAQAAKAETDKAITLITAQISTKSNNDSTTYMFGGCEKGSYPSFSGSLTVNELIPNGMKLSSGHTLLYGNCTKSIKVQKGDLINFVGYIKDGVINSLQFTK